MQKFIILEFTNAGFFKKHKGTKDFIFDINGKRKRVESKFYKEPITVNQVSNVLHVLFGERPKPSLRGVAFDKIDYYFDKAMQSYLRINSYTRFNKNLNSDEYISEFMQTKKVVNDAWSTVDFVYWERIRKTLGKELYNEFKSLLSDLFEVSDITKKYTFMELREQVISRNMMGEGTKLELFFDKLILNKKSPLVVYFKHNSRKSEINKAANIKVTVNMGTEKITKISGDIIVPVTDEDIIKINKHKGFATILDGGLVFIKGIFTENRLPNLETYRKVSDISVETY